MNAFRMMTPRGKLDRVYLRTCALWRLLKAGHITPEQAKELADRPIRGYWRKPGWLVNTIDIWTKGPLRRGE